jgi:O-acetyl-ADP-ribose deacetylase (regulator of RNase III)
MKRRIEVLRCSIVDGGTTCIVNASNDSAALGSGVSRAISAECGGAVLQDEMRARLEEDLDGVLEEGDCLVTSSGTSKKFDFVLHVAAVDYRGNKARLGVGNAGVEATVTSAARIQACAYAALQSAADIAAREGRPMSVTFPLLGAGAGHLPPAIAVNAMIAGIRELFHESPEAAIDAIVFAVPEPDRFAICERLVRSAFV